MLHVAADDLPRLFADPDSFARLTARIRIEKLREQVEQGASLAVIEAVKLCIDVDIDLPDWLITAFNLKVSPVITGKDDSWDSALGRPYKPNTHVATQSRNRELEAKVMRMVFEALRDEPSLNIQRVSLFERVAERMGNKPGLRSAVIEKIYRSAVASGKYFDATELRKLLLRKKSKGV